MRPIGAGKNMGAGAIGAPPMAAPLQGAMPGKACIIPYWTGICPVLLFSRLDCIPRDLFPRLTLVGLLPFLPPAKLRSTSPASWIDPPQPPFAV